MPLLRSYSDKLYLTYLAVLLFLLTQTNHAVTSGTVYYNEVIAYPQRVSFMTILDIPPSNLLKLKYQLSFKKEKCCPVLLFNFHSGDWLRGHKYGPSLCTHYSTSMRNLDLRMQVVRA